MKAVLLCAGYGTRLKPLTDAVPKPLVKILNLSVLEYNLNFLRHNGIRDVYVNRHHLPEKFMEIRIPKGIKVTYTNEKEILGTGGGILSFEKYLQGDDFLVMNGDILASFDLKGMISEHQRKKNASTMLLRENNGNATPVFTDDFGNVAEIGGSGTPVYREHMFTGIHILNSSVFEIMKSLKNKKSCIVADYYVPLLRNKERITAVFMGEEDFWYEIGNLDSYLEVNIELLKSLTEHRLPDVFSHYISEEWQGRKDGERITEVVDDIWLGDNSTVDSNATIYPPVFIGRRTVLSRGSRVGPYVILGDDVTIGANTELRSSVILDNANISSDLDIRDTLVAPDFNYRLAKED